MFLSNNTCQWWLIAPQFGAPDNVGAGAPRYPLARLGSGSACSVLRPHDTHKTAVFHSYDGGGIADAGFLASD